MKTANDESANFEGGSLTSNQDSIQNHLTSKVSPDTCYRTHNLQEDGTTVERPSKVEKLFLEQLRVDESTTRPKDGYKNYEFDNITKKLKLQDYFFEFGLKSSDLVHNLFENPSEAQIEGVQRSEIAKIGGHSSNPDLDKIGEVFSFDTVDADYYLVSVEYLSKDDENRVARDYFKIDRRAEKIGLVSEKDKPKTYTKDEIQMLRSFPDRKYLHQVVETNERQTRYEVSIGHLKSVQENTQEQTEFDIQLEEHNQLILQQREGKFHAQDVYQSKKFQDSVYIRANQQLLVTESAINSDSQLCIKKQIRQILKIEPERSIGVVIDTINQRLEVYMLKRAKDQLYFERYTLNFLPEYLKALHRYGSSDQFVFDQNCQMITATNSLTDQDGKTQAHYQTSENEKSQQLQQLAPKFTDDTQKYKMTIGFYDRRIEINDGNGNKEKIYNQIMNTNSVYTDDDALYSFSVLNKESKTDIKIFRFSSMYSSFSEVTCLTLTKEKKDKIRIRNFARYFFMHKNCEIQEAFGVEDQSFIFKNIDSNQTFILNLSETMILNNIGVLGDKSIQYQVTEYPHLSVSAHIISLDMSSNADATTLDVHKYFSQGIYMPHPDPQFQNEQLLSKRKDIKLLLNAKNLGVKSNDFRQVLEEYDETEEPFEQRFKKENELPKNSIIWIIQKDIDSHEDSNDTITTKSILEKSINPLKANLMPIINSNLSSLLEYVQEELRKEKLEGLTLSANAIMDFNIKLGNNEDNYIQLMKLFHKWAEDEIDTLSSFKTFLQSPQLDSPIPLDEQLSIENLFQLDIAQSVGNISSEKSVATRSEALNDKQKILNKLDEHMKAQERKIRNNCLRNCRSQYGHQVKVSYIPWYPHDSKHSMTDLKLSKICLKVMEECKGNINQMDMWKGMIDHQFQASRFIMLKLALLFTLLQAYPVLYTILGSEEEYEFKEKCQRIYFGSTIFFIVIELNQLGHQGMKYFDIWNFLQIIMLSSYILHFYIVDPKESQLPLRGLANEVQLAKLPDSAEAEIRNWQVQLLHVVVVTFTMIQYLYFLRISQTFGQMVQLVTDCIGVVYKFLIYYILLLFFFSIISQVLGSEVGGYEADGESYDYDYENLSTFWVFFLRAFRDSIGDLSAPSYPYWEDQLKEESKSGNAYAMIVMIWAFWLISILMFTILLLNFLISVISQSYEDTMMRSEQELYNQRAQLNLESRIFVEIFNKNSQFNFTMIEWVDRKLKENNKTLKGLFYAILIIGLIAFFFIQHFAIIVFIIGPHELGQILKRDQEYKASIVVYQRQEDIDAQDQWLGLIRTLQNQIQSKFKNLLLNQSRSEKKVIDHIKQTLKPVRNQDVEKQQVVEEFNEWNEGGAQETIIEQIQQQQNKQIVELERKMDTIETSINDVRVESEKTNQQVNQLNNKLDIILSQMQVMNGSSVATQ